MNSEDDYHAKMLTMAENLLSATKEGKISWRLTDVEGKFIYSGTRSAVTIEYVADRYEGDTTVLCLLNSRGTVVDTLETGANNIDEKWKPNAWNKLLEDLYQAARRIAHNVDEALNSMMSDIERGTPSSAPNPRPKASADPWEDTAPSGYSDEPPF